MERQRLNFPIYTFKISLRGGKEHIWDHIRGCWLRCTPEEWVRQHTARWLTENIGVVPQYIVQEYAVCMEGMPQRADLVVFDQAARPVMLLECKAPEVVIDEAVLAQAVRYNSVVGAKYIMLTNGLKHYFYEKAEDGSYTAMPSPPPLAGEGI